MLALSLGKTVAELLSSITSKELTYWQAYYTLYPFGDLRADIRQAITSKLIADSNREKGKQPFALERFMPKFDTDETDDSESQAKQQSLKEQIAILQQYRAIDKARQKNGRHKAK